MAIELEQYAAIVHRYRNESAKCRAMGRSASIPDIRQEFDGLADAYEKLALATEQMSTMRRRPPFVQRDN
jgi:hypothetical protein